MSVFNRLILRSSANVLKSTSKSRIVQQQIACSFSTLLEKKELAEESKYIRQQEIRRQEEMRKKIDAILAQEDSSKEKQELQALLGPKVEEEKKSILADWKFGLPIGIMLVTPAVFNEWIIIDAEFQLATCFVIAMASFYTVGGPYISAFFDGLKKEQMKRINKMNSIQFKKIEILATTSSAMLSLENDYRTIHTVTDEIATAQADVLNQLEEAKYREEIIKKLDSLSALEESASNAIRNRIVTTVKNDVLKTLKSDKKIQENALNQAMAILAAGSNSKLGKDIVGEVFVSSLKNYKDNYSKQAPGSDEILLQLEKDVANITTAPETGKGGNVYERL